MIEAKVDQLPPVHNPVEGVDYQVIAGAAVAGDFVRLTKGSTVLFTVKAADFVPPPPVAVVLDGADWREHAYGELGKIALPAGDEDQQEAAGAERYGDILNAGRLLIPASGAIAAAFDQYDDAKNFRKKKVTRFLTVLLIAGILTQAEFDAIITNWPVA